MIKKISVILFITLNIVVAQDSNIKNTNNNIESDQKIQVQENNEENNFFNTTIENNNQLNEPAILQDIRNIENRAQISNSWMFIKAIIGFIITLIGIYLVFIYLKTKTKKVYGTNEIIKVIATTTIATNRYISIIEIIDDMYLVSISDQNINLLSKIEDKETKDQIKMMYINSKNNVVNDSFKNILNQTLSIFRQPIMQEKDPIQTTSEIRERLHNLNNKDNNENI